jgi:hypothetical protein
MRAEYSENQIKALALQRRFEAELLGSFIREDVVPCGNLDVSLKLFYYLRK